MSVKFRGAWAGLILLVGAGALVAACGDDDGDSGQFMPPGTGGAAGATGKGGAAGTAQGGSTQDAATGVCLLNNCKSNEECKGCGDSRQTCDTVKHTCIACNGTTLKCPDGQICSEYGTCISSDKTCPTDANGVPSINCTMDADCVACDAAHRVCDTTKNGGKGACVGCSPSNLTQCLQSDYCKDNKCTSKCPASCTADNDCMQCGGTGDSPNAAHACFNHKCAKCSPTFKCPADKQCVNGTCVPPCGLPGPESGTCLTKEDCAYCGIADSKPDADGGLPTGTWDCKFPVNGADRGTCKPTAAGCEDLGKGVIVLPEPYNQYTELCSNDANCADVGIQYNVGKQIRDWMGSSELDLGFAKVTISDASVTYGMNKCASINIINDKSCGICVPCKEDKDCKPIAIDPLFNDLFKGEALAQVAMAVLIDMLFGDIQEHNLNFFCQPVAAGYGACIPCANPFVSCAQGSSGGSGNCDHDVCTAGTALDPKCGDCAAEVCKNDNFCCTDEWDSVCVGAVNTYCAGGCGGTNPDKCAHGPCEAGVALDKLCSDCVASVCTTDSFCCNATSGEWDSYCVDAAKADTKCASACTAGSCAHPECEMGGPLKADCSPCATAVCGADDYCCTTDWDDVCLEEAKKHTECNCQ